MNKSPLIIITGGNRGIGYALIEKLLNYSKKPTIIFTSRKLSDGQTVLDDYGKLYPNEKSRIIHRSLDINSSTSIQDFKQWLAENFGSFDVLVNNAAITNRRDTEEEDFHLTQEEIKSIVQTNFYSTVEMTETLLPLLSSNGKIVMVSSNFGQLSHQGKSVQNFLNDPKINGEILLKEMDTFLKKALNYEHIKSGYSKPVYKVTKAFLNAYTRWVLPNLLKENQTCFACHPGWCQTRMGGTEAPSTAEEGTTSLMRAIDFDAKQSKEFSGKYLNENGEVDEF